MSEGQFVMKRSFNIKPILHFELRFAELHLCLENSITCKKVTIQELANVVEIEFKTYHYGYVRFMFTTAEIKRMMPFLRKILDVEQK